MLYAVKVMNKRHVLKEEKVQQVLTELNILTQLSHPFIINLHYAFQSVFSS